MFTKDVPNFAESYVIDLHAMNHVENFYVVDTLALDFVANPALLIVANVIANS